VPEQQGVRPPEQALSRETVLRICLALDDGALAWVYQALFVDRASVMEQVVKAWTTNRTEKLNGLEGSVNGQKADDSGMRDLTQNGFVEVVGEAEKPSAPLEPEAQIQVAGKDRSSSDDTGDNDDPQRRATYQPEALTNGMDEGEVSYLHDLFATRDRKIHGEPPDALVPRIQFWTSMCYTSEADESNRVEVAVIRIGDVSKRSAAQYETKDISAKAGKKYTAASGKVVFEKGERLKFVYINILNDESWDATLEFEVVLKDAGLENAVLEEALAQCRIKIIDDDCFPTNKFQQQIMSADPRRCPRALGGRSSQN